MTESHVSLLPAIRYMHAQGSRVQWHATALECMLFLAMPPSRTQWGIAVLPNGRRLCCPGSAWLMLKSCQVGGECFSPFSDGLGWGARMQSLEPMPMQLSLGKAGSEELLSPDALLNIGTGKPKAPGALSPPPTTCFSPWTAPPPLHGCQPPGMAPARVHKQGQTQLLPCRDMHHRPCCMHMGRMKDNVAVMVCRHDARALGDDAPAAPHPRGCHARASRSLRARAAQPEPHAHLLAAHQPRRQHAHHGRYGPLQCIS